MKHTYNKQALLVASGGWARSTWSCLDIRMQDKVTV